MEVSIVIVNYNGKEVLQQCLTSLKELKSQTAFEIIVVDNASEDGSVQFLKNECSDVVVVESPINIGFGRACNLGTEHSKGKYLLFLNPDTKVREDIISPLVRFLVENLRAGIVSPKIINEDGSIQLSCGSLPSIPREVLDKTVYALARNGNSMVKQWIARKYSQTMEVEWVTGAAFMIRAEVFRRVGGFDGNIFMYFEDKDICKRVRESGPSIWYFPSASVMHLLGRGSTATTAVKLREMYRKSQKYYYSKHLGLFQQWLLAMYHGVST